MTNRGSPAWRLFILAIGAIALLGLVAAAACGDDDGGGDGNGDPTATASDGDGNGNGDGDPTATSNGDGNGDGSSLGDLSDIIGQYAAFVGTVTYDMSGLTSGDDDTIAIYQDGTSLRYDFGTGDNMSISITTPDASYQCADNVCLQLPGSDAPAAGIGSFLSAFGAANLAAQIGALPDGVDVETSSDSIAGIDATCYKYSGDFDDTQAGDESSEMCFSSGGLMLRTVFNDASGGGSIVATAASEDPPDASVFEPPYPIEDLGDLPPEVCEAFPDLC